MSLATPELLNAVFEIATIKEMKIALNVSTQCGIITSLITVAGGLIGGPPGIAVGGLIGTALASYHASGKFKSVHEILLTEATADQKEKLASALRNLLTAENILTVIQFAATINSDRLLLEAVKKCVQNFVSKDMGYYVL